MVQTEGMEQEWCSLSVSSLSSLPIGHDCYLKIYEFSFQEIYLIIKQFSKVSGIFQNVTHEKNLLTFHKKFCFYVLFHKISGLKKIWVKISVS